MKSSSYAFDFDAERGIRNLYWGKKIEKIEDFEELHEERNAEDMRYLDYTKSEYSFFGGMRFNETAIKVEFADGTKDVRYEMKGYEIEENELRIFLNDIHYALEIVLHYQVLEEIDILKRHVSISNYNKEPVILERAYSAQFAIEESVLKSINYNGNWGAEFRKTEEVVAGGKKIYESLRGSTSHVANPVFILHDQANEEKGNVYFGMLEYSGNFKIVIEDTPYSHYNVLMGISDTDFVWKLQEGETFETPAVYAGFSAEGFSGMTHSAHKLALEHIMPKFYAKKPLKVLYNSWYATLFDVQCEEQKRLAKKAAEIGVELFVVDDGWFGKRTDDTKSLGDWFVDEEKFPNGLQELIVYVKELGMDFGLWIEPEMVNPDSDLYRKHPEWVYSYKNREILQGRNQYTLNLTREDVVEFMIEAMDKLLNQYDISYIKWDMNRLIAETGGVNDDSISQKSVWVKHTQNLYRVIEEVRKRYPNVEFEACAAGGGRVDFGAMKYFDEYWPSDNTDPFDRLSIQENYSFLYPIKYMRAWVGDTLDHYTRRSTIPLEFALHTSMCGALGIGNNLDKLTENELKQIQTAIGKYKELRECIQFGILYRLKSMEKDEIHAVQYVKDTRSVVFAFLTQGKYGKDFYFLKLKGLQREVAYRVCIDDTTFVRHGDFLMNKGLELRLKGDYDSCLIEIEENI